MRKICVITLLACLALLPLAGSAQGYLTITQMYEQVPQRWTQDYETKWRTVSIDVQPVVPQADKLPILKVIPDFWLPDVSALGAGWSSEVSERSTFFADLDDVEPDAREKGKTTTTNYYPPFDMNVSYAQNSPLKLNDVIDQMQRIVGAMGEARGQWRYSRPERILINTTVSKKTGEPLFPDIYTVCLQQKLQDIPILCHVLSGVEEPKDQELQYWGGLTFRICTPEAISVFGKQVRITDMLAEDVPLCDFAMVKSAIEQKIQSGHIRKIFDVELGYALYNEPGVSRKPGMEWLKTAVFYAVPAWRVNCYYVENARAEIRDYTKWDVPQRSEIEYKTLIVNAQTGVALDRSDNRKGCGDYAGFLSWEEAGGRE